MGINSAAIFELRGTGSDSNGCFFVPGTGGTVDYSQQNSSQLSLSDVVTDGTTTVTSATGGFTSAMVNNGINIAGTLYQITAVGSSTSITIDRNAGAATGQTAKVGGAGYSPGFIWPFLTGQVNSQASIVHIGGNITISTSSYNVAGGGVSGEHGGSCSSLKIFGYASTRGDGGKAILTASVGGVNFFENPTQSNDFYIENVTMDGGGHNCNGIYGLFGNNAVFNCEAVNMGTGIGFQTYQQAAFKRCFAKNCSSGFVGATGAAFTECVAVNCTNYNFTGMGGCTVNCVSIQGGSGNHWAWNNQVQTISHCTFVGTGVVNGAALVTDCIFYGSVSFDTYGPWTLETNAFYGGSFSPNRYSGVALNRNPITITTDPFVNASATINSIDDAFTAFALNSTAGGGAACKGAGSGGFDLGAVQSAGGGGSSIPKIWTGAGRVQ